MDTSLLTTKLQIPPRTHHEVRRKRLTDAIESGMRHYTLVLLSAPAGYGKTTLLAQWAHTSDLPVAWLSLSTEDNVLERFLRYLLAAWETARPGVQESKLGLLLGSPAPDRDAVLAAFLNLASDVPDHTVFVLDDYHLVEDPAIHQAMTFLLDHVPPTLHFVLAGRVEPPLPLARYRASHALWELRAADLHFSLEETGDFFRRRMQLHLSAEELVALQTRLEGWIAGLQLVALSRQHHLAPVDPGVVSGSHRFIADYLSEDVLAQLPPATRDFLLRTSILERLCGALCNAVAGGTGGQAMLETLEQQNLFLVPLDNQRQWYRYHHLFADFLREQLSRHRPDEIAPLHRRAARWYLARDLPDPAFRHAVEGEDVELVLAIAVRYVPAKLLGSEIRVVQRWIDLLPAEWHATYPSLGLFRAGVLLVTGQFDACANCLDTIEAQTGAHDETWTLARVTALRCYIACFQNDLAQAEALAARALQDLPEDDVGFRPGVYGALGDTYRRHGRWEEAEACYLKLLDYAHAPAFRVQAVHVYGSLADLELRQGHLRQAAEYWDKALGVIQEQANWGTYPLPLTGWVYIRMGELLYEWNELPQAWEHLVQGLERAELGGDVRAMIAGYLIAGRLKLTQGDREAAAAYLEQARPHLQDAQFAHWISRFERLQLELWLAQERLRAAVNWSDQMLHNAAIEGRPESAITQLAMARVLIVKGDRPATRQALALLERLLQSAQEEGQTGVTVEALALQALAQWQHGERAASMIALERALRLAEPQGYVRLFADLGLPMARLLQEAHSRDVLPRYVERLLTAFIPAVAPSPSAGAALPEPLTDREQEILGLIAAGLTNREIAGQLVISPETVKKHASSIYGKLHVSNRTQATARARELGLLT